MTTAEVRQHPGRSASSPRIAATGAKTLTVNQDVASDHAPSEGGTYTAAVVLYVAMAAYQRGRDDAASQAGRDQWRREEVVSAFRAARLSAEISWMRDKAQSRYLARGYPDGYDYKGGPVDWETGLPAGSACAWLRRQRRRTQFELASGAR
jgi:hypothetical protein